MPVRRVVVAIASVVAFIALASAALVRGHAAAPQPRPRAFAQVSVVRGAALARLGDCAVCHTRPGGAVYAGGRAIPTPFGVVYASNITPDAGSGIGGWSRSAFRRALRDGVARDGAHLYPAFPYDHFTRLTDADIGDLYAFLMTRSPVRAAKPANRLIPPLGFRPLLAGWDLLFLRHRAVPNDPGQSPEWNRGRYLAEALGHCGACHTPRNILGAERQGRLYAGGWSDGWFAPPIGAASPAARSWTADELFTYLRTGLSPSHAAAAGPMGTVTNELSGAPPGDVHALAVYFAALMARAPVAGRRAPSPADQEVQARQGHPAGAALFAGACATCHAAGAPMMLQGRPPLQLGTPLREADPRDTIQIILQGLKAPVGRSGPYMPAFASDFSDAQVADLLAYLRARYGPGSPWPGDLAGAVAKARREAAG